MRLHLGRRDQLRHGRKADVGGDDLEVAVAPKAAIPPHAGD